MVWWARRPLIAANRLLIMVSGLLLPAAQAVVVVWGLEVLGAALAGIAGGLLVTLSVPGGDRMALKTTNARLGIVGGISILGTTGIVRPFSTAAFRASVAQQVDVACAVGERHLVLATGSRSEAAAMRMLAHLPPVCFVEVGDYTGVALGRAAAGGARKVTMVAMAGKIAKLAAGVTMTHFHRSKVDNGVLASAAAAAGAGPAVSAAATETATARHFFEACVAAGDTAPLHELCVLAASVCRDRLGGEVDFEMWMVDFEGRDVVARS
nr:cobalt-precorrin-5B (C(1))-methyltransferase CbiD [Actinomycetota bacterium]